MAYVSICECVHVRASLLLFLHCWLVMSVAPGLSLTAPRLQLNPSSGGTGTHIRSVLKMVWESCSMPGMGMLWWAAGFDRLQKHFWPSNLFILLPHLPEFFFFFPNRKLYPISFEKYSICIWCLRFLKLGPGADGSRGKVVGRKNQEASSQSINSKNIKKNAEEKEMYDF